MALQNAEAVVEDVRGEEADRHVLAAQHAVQIGVGDAHDAHTVALERRQPLRLRHLASARFVGPCRSGEPTTPIAARQVASTTRTGRRLRPFVKFERRRAGGPVSSIEREARQQLLEEHRHLEPGEVRAEAEVRAAAAERRVHVALAREVEPVRIGERLGIAVGRREPHDDALALRGSRTPRSSVSATAVRRKCQTGEA